MGYQYLATETEETATHGEDDLEESTRYQELRLAAGLLTDDEEKAIEIAKKQMNLVVCSCGSSRCYMINKFGHPRPVFDVAIQPIPSQFQRDREALRLKGES